jgi:hypothetical protein
MDRDLQTQPWWRHGMVWLVIGGPAVVVVASFATLAIAITHPDPVLSTRTLAADDAAAPAVHARNHVNSSPDLAPPASPAADPARLPRPGANAAARP